MSTNQIDRQPVLAIVVDLGPENMGAGNGYTAKLPQGACVVDVDLITVTAFDSETTATGSIGDGSTNFVNAQDVKSTGKEASAVNFKFYPEGGEITFSLAQTGAAATAGRAIGVVRYVQLGAGGDIYG